LLRAIVRLRLQGHNGNEHKQNQPRSAGLVNSANFAGPTTTYGGAFGNKLSLESLAVMSPVELFGTFRIVQRTIVGGQNADQSVDVYRIELAGHMQ
jgi:hypothetical protein